MLRALASSSHAFADFLLIPAPLLLTLTPKIVLRELLHPRTWKPSEDRSFILNAEQINELCDEAERIFRDEATVLQLQGAELWRVRRGRRVGGAAKQTKMGEVKFWCVCTLKLRGG